ncbi:unnamed protein product [Bursaphelenchus okinawaensis]|uniref:Non-lysosomal glucosylceramidase n=1 Tax=Bursaphelenchus okinawaensis TaxID=465554 RepID=A0A811JRV5_9BILA|nr:unnamed protein product [Bursaphelenchus okinawaensis]CAG9080735.1 unnamed protein product [Bursaphelenchus okinawaensis]
MDVDTETPASTPRQWTPSEQDVIDLEGEYGWIARGDKRPVEKRLPFNRPKLMQVYRVLPFVARYARYWVRNYNNRDRLFINTFEPLKHKHTYGVPCGTIGSGSIGRDFRGGFCKFGLKPGLVEHHVKAVKANQFILTLRKSDGETKQLVLGVNEHHVNQLNNWKFGIEEENIIYRGLYPRSWTVYKISSHNVKVVITQTSPVIPNNYKDSSLPVTLFHFKIINESNEDIEAAITFTFRNGTGCKKTQSEGMCKSLQITSPSAKGLMLKHEIAGMDTTYCVMSSDVDATSVAAFDPNALECKLWDSLEQNMNLNELEAESEATHLAVACSTYKHIKMRESTSFDHALVWHMPKVHFTSKKRSYKRYYTKFFDDEAPDTAFDIGCYALGNKESWERQIDEWQNVVLLDQNVPLWFKSALFNELYYLTDGGTVWFAYDESWKQEEQHLSDYTLRHFKDYGRFAYLESWEYRMMNTYDVHFYASFALAELFPWIECTVQMEMRDQFENHVSKQVRFHMEGDRAPIKTQKRVPHDLGNPADEPFLKVNAYIMHDTGKWKDLNLKFVLTSYRDYVILMDKSPEYLDFVYPAVRQVIEEGLTKWDKNGDSMIENFGAADQTYDAWKMVGVSAYCGSLWLGALVVALKMAEDMKDEAGVKKYGEALDSAKRVFDTVLWNGSYYNFDQASNSNSTIMADQLCGFWYLQSIDAELVRNLLPQSHVDSVLETVFNYNVVKFADCTLGAVNGMLPNGKIDRSYIQADEVWVGITYSLASFFIQQNQLMKGFETAAGCYDACFNRFGLQYQTPEALYRGRFYRAIGYMRPLAIWSMFTALKKQKFFTAQ